MNFNKRTIIYVLAGLASLAVIFGSLYLVNTSKRVYAENAYIDAPVVNLVTQTNGILEVVFVKAGDKVPEFYPVARVGNELIKSQVSGEILSVRDDVGTVFSKGQTIVSMIDPEELRVVARIEEDKGLNEIKIGQSVIFELDAFASKEYSGVVDEISPTSREGDIVFNISGKRQTKEFNVKIRFDVSAYPEIKNGMSAKAWIYK
jgi:multidrug resistance efflux pump